MEKQQNPGPQLIALTDSASLRAAGIHWPASENAWRWLRRHAKERGLEAAFVTVGRRVLVNVPVFLVTVAQQGAIQRSASA